MERYQVDCDAEGSVACEFLCQCVNIILYFKIIRLNRYHLHIVMLKDISLSSDEFGRCIFVAKALATDTKSEGEGTIYIFYHKITRASIRTHHSFLEIIPVHIIVGLQRSLGAAR
jgi:hypothetical protein